jgi:hypothetical protein
VPQPGGSWRPQGRPATRPHEYIRGGTCKILTLFHPATGRVHLRPVVSCTNPVLHGWLKERLARIVAALPARAEPADPAATRAAWGIWQEGLTQRFTLPEPLPPLRLLLVWDNLAGHKTAEMVVWLCRHGIMPLYTPLGGSWLNMAEAIQRILKRRTLDGQHPQSPAEIGAWFEQTARLEPAAHALPLERQAPATAAQTTRRPTRHRRRRGTYVAAVTSPPKRTPRMADSGASDPLGVQSRGVVVHL